MKKTNKKKLYRNKYTIGLYTDDIYELCITVLDNISEFADYAQVSQSVATLSLYYAFTKQRDHVIINGKRVKVEFIEETDDSED